MNDMTQPKVLIVDDDSVLQKFLQDYLAQNDFHVDSLHCGEDIEDHLKTHNADIILLDIVMPGKDGYYWLDWLKDNHPKTPVLMLSVKGESGNRVQGLEMGANDYIVKPADPRELLARIKNILNLTTTPTTGHRITFGDFIFDTQRSNLFHGEETIRLTETEAQLLKILCSNPNKTLSRDELTMELRGNEHNPYDRSIDVHINRLRNKIEDDPATPQYLLTTWGKGYRFVMTD